MLSSSVLNQVVLIRIINIPYHKNLSIKKHRREAVFLTDILSFGEIPTADAAGS
jgi:hypothetical protein